MGTTNPAAAWVSENVGQQCGWLAVSEFSYLPDRMLLDTLVGWILMFTVWLMCR